MSTEALKVETFIFLLDFYIKRLAIYIVARIYTIKAAKGIKSMCNGIYQQTVDRRERQAIPRSSLLDYMNA